MCCWYSRVSISIPSQSWSCGTRLMSEALPGQLLRLSKSYRKGENNVEEPTSRQSAVAALSASGRYMVEKTSSTRDGTLKTRSCRGTVVSSSHRSRKKKSTSCASPPKVFHQSAAERWVPNLLGRSFRRQGPGFFRPAKATLIHFPASSIPRSITPRAISTHFLGLLGK